MEDIGALLPITLGLRQIGARPATATGHIRAVLVLVVLVVVLRVPQLLRNEVLSTDISECCCKRCQIPSRLAGRMVPE